MVLTATSPQHPVNRQLYTSLQWLQLSGKPRTVRVFLSEFFLGPIKFISAHGTATIHVRPRGIDTP